MKTKEQLQQLVGQNKTGEAIRELKQATQSKPKLYNELLLLEAQFNDFKSLHRTGTERADNLGVVKRQIDRSLLQIIDQAFERPPQPGSSQKNAFTSKDLAYAVRYTLVNIFKQPAQNKTIWLLLILAATLLLDLPKRIGQLSVLTDYKTYLLGGILTLLLSLIIYRIWKILQNNRNRLRVDYTANSPIKGLRSFDFEDAEIFKPLQRAADVEVCLNGLLQSDFRFGVLSGESGCGKTSFVRAGLHAALEEKELTCTVVKLTNEAPLESISKALARQLPGMSGDKRFTDLYHLLEYALSKTPKGRLALILDQFEQFFTHQKTADERKGFIEQLKKCYEELAGVKILFSLRKDFAGYLHEIQKEIDYLLRADHNYFDLRKFTSKQAAAIFQIMAESEGMEYDEAFIQQICRDELASKEDGLISAVDIQILAFIVKGRQSSDKAFTRSAFQRMGGIHGLLQSYLRKQFETPNYYNANQAALKVLLAFIDLENNVRIGELTIDKLSSRLAQNMDKLQLQSILSWLEDLRLVTKTEKQAGEEQYELAHERLIAPLRELAGKALEPMAQADIILERRANEWISNGKKSRFLLSWPEYRNIQKHKKLLTWGKNEQLKQDLIQASRRKFQRWAGITGMAALVVLAYFGFNRQSRAVDNLLILAKEDVLGLKYDSAMVKILEAGKKRVQQRNVGKALMEVAFYYNEVGDYAQSLDLSKSVVGFLRNRQAKDLINQAEADTRRAQILLREAFQLMDTDSFLIKRYFPEMIAVQGGIFMLGCLKNDCDTNETTVATLSDYRIAKTETTVWQYNIFAKQTGRDISKPDDWDWLGDTPVIYVSWFDVIAYSNWLSARFDYEKVYDLGTIPVDPNDMYQDTSIVWREATKWENKGFRLPTEAEWEYAARGGIRQDTFIFSGGNTLDSVGWHGSNSAEQHRTNRTNKVAAKAANSLGVFDMSGNVWEWCWDWYSAYQQGTVNNPVGLENGEYRVLRGGSWYYFDYYCRVSFRYRLNPNNRFNNYGFRVSQGL